MRTYVPVSVLGLSADAVPGRYLVYAPTASAGAWLRAALTEAGAVFGMCWLPGAPDKPPLVYPLGCKGRALAASDYTPLERHTATVVTLAAFPILFHPAQGRR